MKKTQALPKKIDGFSVETWPLEKIVPYPQNARKISAAAVDAVAASLKEFGWQQPIVVDSAGVIVVGHARRMGAKQLGWTEAPVHVARNLSATQIRAYRLADNRTNENTRWDMAVLAVEMKDLAALGVDLASTAFSEVELQKALGTGLDPSADELPPTPVVPTARPGDLWLIGPHRILCGDSSLAADVERCLDGAKPALMVTDPPYGVELDGEWRDRAGLNKLGPAEANYMMRKKVEAGVKKKKVPASSDIRSDWSDSFALVPSLEVAYVWHASVNTAPVILGLERIGFVYKQHIVWDKGIAVLMHQHYWYEHEPCWYVRKPNAPWYGRPGEASSIWRAPSPKIIMGGSKEEKFDHPTQKPVMLMQRSILNHLKKGELVYEPFLGSGTTMAAAQITSRVCYGLEIDPRFVDVEVARIEKLAGVEATLEGTKKTFAKVKKERARETE